MKPKLIGSLVLMLALGAALFVVMVALMQTRIGRPVTSAQNEVRIAAARPVETLTTGLKESLVAAKTGLENRRQSESVRALDAAMRASEVADYALKSTRNGPAFEAVHRTIMQARVAIQNDSRSAAARLVESALTALPDGNTDAAPTPQDLSQYTGARVINAEGVRVGEVKGIENGTVVLTIGGHYDLFGFIDLGGQELRVDANQLLFGKKKSFGNTFVAIPTTATSPNELALSFRNAR
jgi:hypothetical protein